MTPARGQVYRCDVGFGLKPWLIVSNNARNRHTADVLAIRLTTTVRQLPTWVPLSSGDPLAGYANADNIETLGKDELGDHLHHHSSPSDADQITAAVEERRLPEIMDHRR
jgi:mRNA interferase MazF